MMKESKVNIVNRIGIFFRFWPILSILTTKQQDCPVVFELYSQLQLSFHKRFRGVVGYHIRLTRGRSPVRTRTKTNSFSLIILQEISEFEHKTSIYHLCALFLRAERGQSLRDTKYDFVDDHLFE